MFFGSVKAYKVHGAQPILSGPVMVLAAYGRDMGGGWCLRACVRWVSMLRAFFLPVPVRLRTTDVIFGPRLSALALVIRFRVSQRISTPLDEPDRSMYLRFSIFFFCGSYRPKTIFGGAGWTRRWETAIKTFIFRRFRPARVRRRKSRRKIPKNKNFYLEMTNIVTTRRPPLYFPADSRVIHIFIQLENRTTQLENSLDFLFNHK